MDKKTIMKIKQEFVDIGRRFFAPKDIQIADVNSSLEVGYFHIETHVAENTFIVLRTNDMITELDGEFCQTIYNHESKEHLHLVRLSK